MKNIDMFKIILSVLITIIISVCGILYAQQNEKIDGKVDNKVLQQMIIRLEEKDKLREKENDRLFHQNEEQQKINMDMLKVLQEMKTEIKVLNKKMGE